MSTPSPETPAGARGAVDLTGFSGAAGAGRAAGVATSGASVGEGAGGAAGPQIPDGLLIEASDATFNQVLSSTSGTSRRATSVRIALKPHWASENEAPRNVRRMRW